MDTNLTRMCFGDGGIVVLLFILTLIYTSLQVWEHQCIISIVIANIFCAYIVICVSSIHCTKASIAVANSFRINRRSSLGLDRFPIEPHQCPAHAPAPSVCWSRIVLERRQCAAMVSCKLQNAGLNIFSKAETIRFDILLDLEEILFIMFIVNQSTLVALQQIQELIADDCTWTAALQCIIVAVHI